MKILTVARGAAELHADQYTKISVEYSVFLVFAFTRLTVTVQLEIAAAWCLRTTWQVHEVGGSVADAQRLVRRSNKYWSTESCIPIRVANEA
jgi:hypothetical protein